VVIERPNDWASFPALGEAERKGGSEDAGKRPLRALRRSHATASLRRLQEVSSWGCLAKPRPLGARRIIAASGGARAARIGDSHDDAALPGSIGASATVLPSFWRATPL